MNRISLPDGYTFAAQEEIYHSGLGSILAGYSIAPKQPDIECYFILSGQALWNRLP
jgi:hypothetical protein